MFDHSNNKLAQRKKVLISNIPFNFHYEIIESVIVKYKEILHIHENCQLYLNFVKNHSFEHYIQKKYPNIIFSDEDHFDFYIECTVYDRDADRLNSTETNIKYIAHEITDKLLKNPNVYYLTPLSKQNWILADVLPFMESRCVTDIPIYVIQGNLNQNRRKLSLLIRILENDFPHKFILKMIGRGSLPSCLQKYKDRIVLKNNLDFANYHREFLDAYCILPLISKHSHPHYYSTKLTSTINYAKAYKLKCVIDSDLQDIYRLDNVEVYKEESCITEAFSNTLNEFYSRKH